MKDYKKILEGVINIIATTEKTDIGFANICSYLSDNCDELFENEGERIRKDGRELEIEQAAILKNYKLPTMRIGFEQGAKWADKHPRRGLVDIEKACEWWTEELITPTMTKEGRQWFNNKVNAFRKAMKGGSNEK